MTDYVVNLSPRDNVIANTIGLIVLCVVFLILLSL